MTGPLDESATLTGMGYNIDHHSYDYAGLAHVFFKFLSQILLSDL